MFALARLQVMKTFFELPNFLALEVVIHESFQLNFLLDLYGKYVIIILIKLKTKFIKCSVASKVVFTKVFNRRNSEFVCKFSFVIVWSEIISVQSPNSKVFRNKSCQNILFRRFELGSSFSSGHFTARNPPP